MQAPNPFGSHDVKTIEIFFDESSGWTVRAHSGPERSGAVGYLLVTAGDVSLTAAATVTVPVVLARAGLGLAGDWHIDEDSHSVWAAVAPLAPPHPGESVPGRLSDAEVRWLPLGVGRSPSPAKPRRRRRSRPD